MHTREALRRNIGYSHLPGLAAPAGLLILAAFPSLAPASDWPCYRGPNKDGATAEQVTRWPLQELWRASVGQGFSGVTVTNGCVYTMGWSANQDTVYCFSESATGTNPPPLWSRSYSSAALGTYNGTRATPTADGDELYTFSHGGRVGCYNRITGAPLWSTNLNAVGTSTWGYASSPLVEGNLVIVNKGDRGTALNKATGAVAWGNDTNAAGCASPWAFTQGGTQRVVVVFGYGKVSGVNPANGSVLWHYSPGGLEGWADPILSGDKLWVSRGFAAGNAVVSLGSGQLFVDQPGEYALNTMANKRNCSVLYNGYVYGISEGAGLRCVEFSTGSTVWSQSGFGNDSALMRAGNQLVIMNGTDLGDNGDLVIARATPSGYQEVCRANDILFGNTWTTPTLANGRLYLRSQTGALICYRATADVENDGLADDWEDLYLGGTNASPTADADGDGWNNLAEYIAGTNPTNNNGRLEVRIARSGGQVVVSYPTIRTNGPGYDVLNRYYSLEHCTNPPLTGWLPVPGATDVAGDNTTKAYTNAAPANAGYYRVKVSLQ